MAFEQRDDVRLPECVDMALGKTGALLAASAEVGAVLAGATPTTAAAMSDYGRHVGLAFQLVDDVLGIWGRPETTGKPVFSDLRAHKKSLPITWTVERGDGAGRRLAAWLVGAPDETAPEAELRAIAGLVEDAGARDWALAQARRRIGLAERALDSVPLQDAPCAALRDLARFIVDRQA
jgi:geranylgeranyl diphosphate synthase type I